VSFSVGPEYGDSCLLAVWEAEDEKRRGEGEGKDFEKVKTKATVNIKLSGSLGQAPGFVL